MKDTNYSVVGQKAQDLPLLFKIGSGVFILGLLFLVDGHFTHYLFPEKKAIFYGFGALVLGAMLFTFNLKSHQTLYNIYAKNLNFSQIIGVVFSFVGLAIVFCSWFGLRLEPAKLYLVLLFGSLALGIGFYAYGTYAKHTAGIKNNHLNFNSLTNRGIIAWLIGILLTFFYIQLYWNADSLKNLITLFTPLSQTFRGKDADQWFVYGTFYTFIILFLGAKFMVKYRHNRYQLIRTVVVMFSQLVFAYFLPHIMEAMSYNSASDASGEYLGYYTTNPVDSWPLNYHFFDSDRLVAYTQKAYQPVGIAYFVWGILMFLVITPIVTYYVGKRWYCSWFCGCGGLAETGGDSFRQLSSKSTAAWKIERWVIHSVMVFVLLMTVAIVYPFFSGKEFSLGFLTINKNLFFIIATILLLLGATVLFFTYKRTKNKIVLVGSLIFVFALIFLTMAYFTGGQNVFILKSASIKKAYGFFVGSAFSGVIGVGFYPILGNRVWCRFGCPMAGYMGLFQRFKSRFRITTNGGQCISCGNCSTYCEQGIDVRAYAQKGQNIVRASCVGCGICSAVCPRGVLKLENGPEEGRITDEPNLIGMIK